MLIINFDNIIDNYVFIEISIKLKFYNIELIESINLIQCLYDQKSFEEGQIDSH